MNNHEPPTEAKRPFSEDMQSGHANPEQPQQQATLPLPPDDNRVLDPQTDLPIGNNSSPVAPSTVFLSLQDEHHIVHTLSVSLPDAAPPQPLLETEPPPVVSDPDEIDVAPDPSYEQELPFITQESNPFEYGLYYRSRLIPRPAPPATSSRMPGIILLLMLCLALVLGGGVTYLLKGFGMLNEVHNNQHTFPVVKHPKLVINNQNGAIHIHSLTSSPVISRSTEYVSGAGINLHTTHVAYSRQDDTLTVDARFRNDPLFIGTKAIDLDIVTPPLIDVDIHNNSGSITIDNVHGNINIVTGKGVIIATGISGQMVMQTDSGSITAKTISGQALLTTQGGAITLSQAKLGGQSVLKTTDGAITFNGAIDHKGSYHFEASNGSVELTLPASSAFHLTTSTDTGLIFNAFGRADVGKGERAALSITTQNDAIHLYKAA